jgi:hypothetical protein
MIYKSRRQPDPVRSAFIREAEVAVMPVSKGGLPAVGDEEVAAAELKEYDVENREKPVVEERMERGVRLRLFFPDTGTLADRFLDESWIRSYLENRFGGTCPPLKKTDLEVFAKQLSMRKDPINVAIFDAAVDLEGVRVNVK